METKTVLAFVEAADSIKNTLQDYLDELAGLSPSQIELALGVAMKDTKPGERLDALLKYLDAKPANLRLQIRREHGMLVFGTFWLPGATRIFSFACPASIEYYLDTPAVKQACTNLDREPAAALALLVHLLKVDPAELLRQQLMAALDQHHARVEALLGSPSARARHSRELEELAKKGIFWPEVLKVLRLAREEAASPDGSPLPELQTA